MNKQTNTLSTKRKFKAGFLSLASAAALVIGLVSQSASAQVNILPYPNPSAQKQKTEVLVGQMAVTVDGQAYLILPDNSYYSLVSSLDLGDFNGTAVEVVGFRFKYTVGPVIETMSLDPLQDGSEVTKPEPVFVVLSVREVVR